MRYRLNKDLLLRNTSMLFILIYCSLPVFVFAQNSGVPENRIQTSSVYRKLSTNNPTAEAKALYKFMQSIWGEKILLGQMTNSEGINELDYIFSLTNKKPAILGFDFKTERENNNITNNAIQWWKDGGIPLLMWHWGAPTLGEGFENSQKEILIARCFQEGTAEHTAFWSELEAKADHLEKLRDANVPVLWNPFPQANSEKFWWGKQGPEQFIKLWRTMFNYFTVERNLNNLIWVINFSDMADISWFPGNSFVDVIGGSLSDQENTTENQLFEQSKSIANKIATPLAYHLSSTIPDSEIGSNIETKWSWWMPGSNNNLSGSDQNQLIASYNHKQLVTLNNIPDIIGEFSDETVKRRYFMGATMPLDDLKGFGLGIKPTSIEVNKNNLHIETKGRGFKESKDEGYFAFKPFEGDFDISVKVVNLSPANLYAGAGIMARKDLSRKSPHVYFQAYPNNIQKNNNSGGFELTYRAEDTSETTSIFPAAASGNSYEVQFPDTWIRLKRSGNIFKTYFSYDNIYWYIYSIHEQLLPQKLLVGLAVSSNSKEVSVSADFEEMEITWE